ncbi:MAG: branched-chain amino acid ABC transporter substrate-binding protein [Xanthobacteraceae bacterium]
MKLDRTLATALALAALTLPAQAEPLHIGILESLSGSQTSTGRLYATATQFVIDEANAKGGYNGEKIIVTEYDNAGTTTGAAAKFQQLVADGVHVIVQGSSSAVGGQVSEDVRKYNLRNPDKKIIYLNFGAEALELTGEKCHFHSFRMTTTAPMRVGALVNVMKEEGTLGKRVYSINQNYSWGKDMEDAIKSHAADGGYEVVETVLHDVNKIQDFAPFVAKIQAAKPDTVMTGNWSNDLLLLMKAAGDAGLKTRFATAFLDQPGNIGNAGPVALGHYVAHTFNVELAKGDFADRYQKFSGHIPTYIEPQAVNALRMLFEASRSVDFGGGKIDTTKIAEAMEKTKLETDIGTITFRKEDHQALLPVVVSQVSKDAKYPADGTDMGFKPLKVVQAAEVIYPVQASCKMNRP